MNVASGIASGWFPRASGSELRDKPFPCGVCEAPSAPPAAFTERHLQCVWADDRLRPQILVTAAGERVQVEHPGEWNTGPGPDFLNAALRVGPELRRLTGDVEIHIRPADWQRHRHADDPRYRRVCAHVAFYPGALPAAELPAGALQIANTIRMAAFARRREIGIMRLVGASNIYILLPFLLEPIATQRSAFQSDNLHPVAEAQPKLRDHVWPALAPLLK